MYGAYDALSEPFKRMLSGLTALHESERVYRGRYSDLGVDDRGKSYPRAFHPVIRTHPESGRKAVYVTRTFTTRIREISETESIQRCRVLGQPLRHAQSGMGLLASRT